MLTEENNLHQALQTVQLKISNGQFIEYTRSLDRRSMCIRTPSSCISKDLCTATCMHTGLALHVGGSSLPQICPQAVERSDPSSSYFRGVPFFTV